MEAGKQFEINQTQLERDEALKELKEYIYGTYSDLKSAADTYDYLIHIVEKICKRESYNLAFDSGGGPWWHMNIFKFLSKVVEAEYKLGVLTGEVFMEEMIQVAVLDIVDNNDPVDFDEIIDLLYGRGFEIELCTRKIQSLIYHDKQLGYTNDRKIRRV